MAKQNFYAILQKELDRIEAANTTKREEKIIEGFTKDPSPRAIIDKKEYLVCNSNDYLGLRFNEALREGEKEASDTYGTGPGAVRFISGTLAVYKQLEEALASFHGREAGMIFSSAFATNLAVIFCLIKGQSKDSVVRGETLVISDSLNHRSIIDGIRVAGLSKEQKAIYQHLDYNDLSRVLEENKGKFKRVLVITDGVFSMLGENADLQQLKKVTERFDREYEEGVLLIVDDSHGVGAFGETGRGDEEVSGAKADVLISTLGKAFGADGGYVVADKIIIDYLRESAATYIYSNSVSPGVAGAALASVNLMDQEKGKNLLKRLAENVLLFKEQMKSAGFTFAADSIHPIQPILIGDAGKCKQLVDGLFEKGILVTSINYPVVPAGKDEIRVQISASHTKEDLNYFIKTFIAVGKSIGL